MRLYGQFVVLFLVLAFPAMAQESPSFIVIFTDDQRWDALGLVNPEVQTPHLDALAAEGVFFENAFVTTSICPASRATILTGLHERTHEYTFFAPLFRFELTAESQPKLLRDAGYRTAMIGKSGILFEAGVSDEMFDVFVPLSRLPSYFKDQGDGTFRHLTDITGDRVEEFLAAQDAEQPFSLWVTFNAPHAQYVNTDGVVDQYFEWPERFDDLYEDVTFVPPPTYDPEFLDTQPPFLQTSENHVRGEVLWTPAEYQENLKGYYRMITGLDDVVGRIRGALAKFGLADDTVIFFLSDNGYFIGERGGYSGKWLPHEPSVRVPMIVYDPRMEASRGGTVRQEAVLNLDVASTLLDMAGLEIPAVMQGRSLVPLLQGDGGGWRTDFFVEHLMDPEHPANPFPIPRHEGVRTVDGWKYARYVDQDYEELYYLPEDPWEETNRVEEPTDQAILEQLRARTLELRDLYAGVVFGDGFESGDLSGWASSSESTSDRRTRPAFAPYDE